MQTGGDSIKSQFTLKMLSALDEIKEKYSKRALNDTVSIANGPRTNEELFAEKIQSCKQLLGLGGTSAQSDTLIKIDALKLKFNQISVDDLRRNTSRRNDLSLENIKRTFEELDVKGSNDILHSLSFNDFEWVKHQSAICEGAAKVNKVLLRCTFARIRRTDRFAALGRLASSFNFFRKSESLKEVRSCARAFSLNVRLHKFVGVLDKIRGRGLKSAKLDAFASIKAIARLAALLVSYHEESNMVAISQLKQFGLVFKILNAISNSLKICAKSVSKQIIVPLRRNARFYRGFELLSKKVADVQKNSLRLASGQIVYYVKHTIKENDKPAKLQQAFGNAQGATKKTTLVPVVSAISRQKYAINRKSISVSESNKSQAHNKSSQNFDSKPSSSEEVKVTITVTEQSNRCVGDAMHHFQMTDTIVSELSYRERQSSEPRERDQMPNLIESRIIANPSDAKDAEEQINAGVTSAREINRNESISRIDINSCLKESVPDSDFIKYCEMVFNSKKINYNFSLDNIDVFRNSRQRSENDNERLDNNSFNENSPHLRDIDQWMIFAKKLNNSYELKDQTLDFLKSVDMDAKQRNSYKEPGSDFSLQKKESIKLIGEASPIRVELDNNSYLENFELKDSMVQLMELPIDQAMKTFMPVNNGKGCFEGMKDRRELTAIKEESTLIDKSHCTISKNYSYTLDSKDMHNSFRKQYETANSNALVEPPKITANKQPLKQKISPKNSEILKDVSHGSEIIQHIEGLRGDFDDNRMERQSCNTSNSSQPNDIHEQNKQSAIPRRIPSAVSKHHSTKHIEQKRASVQDRLHTAANYTEKRRTLSNARPSSNFDLRKWTESFKTATAQYRTVCNKAEARSRSKKSQTAKQGQVNANGVMRLKTDHIDPRNVPQAFSKTLRGKLQQPVFTTPTVNYTKVHARPLGNFRQAKSKEETYKTEPQRTEPTAVKDAAKVRPQHTEVTSGKKLSTGLRLSPAPQFRNGKLFSLDKRKAVSQSRAKNFIDNNKKVAFENNIAKYFPKVAEHRYPPMDKARSFNIGRSPRKLTAALTHNQMGNTYEAKTVSKAYSVQYKTSQKSFISNSMVVNKENGSGYNVAVRRGAGQTTGRAKSSDSSLKAKTCGNWAESIKQQRVRQRKADSKFFEVC